MPNKTSLKISNIDLHTYMNVSKLTYLDCKLFLSRTLMLHILILYIWGKQISRPHTFKFKLLLTAAVEIRKNHRIQSTKLLLSCRALGSLVCHFLVKTISALNSHNFQNFLLNKKSPREFFFRF